MFNLFIYCYLNKFLKWPCQEIFLHFFINYSNPSGPLINRLKLFLLKIRFRGDIQIFCLKNSTTHRLPLREVKNFFIQPIKKITKNVGFGLYSIPIDLVLFYFTFTCPLKARRGLQRQNCCWQNSPQCQPARSSTPRSVSHFCIFRNFNQ